MVAWLVQNHTTTAGTLFSRPPALGVQNRIRTGDLLFRGETLYPSELFGHVFIYQTSYCLYKYDITLFPLWQIGVVLNENETW